MGSGGEVFIVNKRSSFPMGYLLVACFLGSLNKTAAPHVWFFLQRETGVWGQIPARDDAMNHCKSVHFLSPLV